MAFKNSSNEVDEYKMGIRYLYGIGVLTDLEQAFIHFNRSAVRDAPTTAAMGFVRAQISLAFMYLDENKPKAYIYFKAVADEEYHSRTQLMVGMMYEYGEGKNQNIEKAIKYYKMAAVKDALPAAEQGNDDARNKLQILNF